MCLLNWWIWKVIVWFLLKIVFILVSGDDGGKNLFGVIGKREINSLLFLYLFFLFWYWYSKWEYIFGML